MNILITGATGFIGSALCQHWCGNHLLTVLTRQPDRVAEKCGSGVKAITNFQQLTSDQPFDVVVNLAGEPIADRRWSANRKQQLYQSRVGVTKDLLAFLERAEQKPKVLISASAVGFYGDQGDRVLDEDSDSVNDFAHQLCRDWEQEAQRARALGIRVCILRLGLVVGSNGGFLKKMLLPFKLGLGGRLGSGQQWMSWVHRDDVLGLIDYLVDHEVLNGVFNATAPKPVSNEEFSRSLASCLHRPCLLPMPEWPLKLLLGEMSGLLLGGQRVLPMRAEQAGYAFCYQSLSDALASVLD
jgi:uncharacterized protein (TIGR01777 family)